MPKSQGRAAEGHKRGEGVGGGVATCSWDETRLCVPKNCKLTNLLFRTSLCARVSSSVFILFFLFFFLRNFCVIFSATHDRISMCVWSSTFWQMTSLYLQPLYPLYPFKKRGGGATKQGIYNFKKTNSGDERAAEVNGFNATFLRFLTHTQTHALDTHLTHSHTHTHCCYI